MSAPNSTPVKVLIKRLENGLCSQCCMRTLQENGEAVPDVQGRVLQGRCLICYPLDGNRGIDTENEELMMKRIDLGRCDTCEMLTSEGGIPVDNERTLMGRCLLCHPVDSKPPLSQSSRGAPSILEATSLASRSSTAAENDHGGNPVRWPSARNFSTNYGSSVGRGIQTVPAEQYMCESGRQFDIGERYHDENATVATGNTLRGKTERRSGGHGRARGAGDQEDSADNGPSSMQASSRETFPFSSVPSAEETRGGDAKRRKPSCRWQDPKGNHQRKKKRLKTSTEAKEAVRDAIQAAKREPDDADLQEEACKLVKMRVDKHNIVAAVNAGAIEMIITAMKNHRETDQVTIECIRALARISWDRPEIANEVAQVGGIDGVVALLQRKSNYALGNKMMAKCILEALSYLVVTPIAVERLFSSSGIKGVIDTMCRYSRSADIHATGCEIIQQITYSNRDAAAQLVQAGAFSAIVAGMKHKVSENAMFALQNLLLCDESRLRFVEEGGLGTLVSFIGQARRRPKRSLDIMEAAGDAFRNLVSVDSNDERRFRDGVLRAVVLAGGIKAVQTLMEKYPASASLQIIGCQSLDELAFSSGSANDIVDAACLPTVIRSMENHSSDELQEAACGALGKIFEFAKVCDASVVEAIVCAMELCPESRGVQENGCWAMHNAHTVNPLVSATLDRGRINIVLEQAADKFSDHCGKNANELIEFLKKVN